MSVMNSSEQEVQAAPADLPIYRNPLADQPIEELRRGVVWRADRQRAFYPLGFHMPGWILRQENPMSVREVFLISILSLCVFFGLAKMELEQVPFPHRWERGLAAGIIATIVYGAGAALCFNMCCGARAKASRLSAEDIALVNRRLGRPFVFALTSAPRPQSQQSPADPPQA